MKLPQLSLRDLFWLVALVAMGCAWWADRQCLSDRIDDLEAPDIVTWSSEKILLDESLCDWK